MKGRLAAENGTRISPRGSGGGSRGGSGGGSGSGSGSGSEFKMRTDEAIHRKVTSLRAQVSDTPR